jgi:3-oxoacyl-[acyl-carrier protein] reductase
MVLKKIITIVGSTSEIAKCICQNVKISENVQVNLLGRMPPKWIKSFPHVAFRHCDMNQDADLESYFREINAEADFSGLVYLPSSQFGRLPLNETSREQIREIIQVSLVCAIETVQSYIRTPPKIGSVILFSSQAATFGGNRISAYAAAKGGVESFVKGMARELGPMKIRINALSPGLIKTDTFIKYAAVSDDISVTVPLGRLGVPKDVANAISWLLSSDSDYISGAIIPITGGR